MSLPGEGPRLRGSTAKRIAAKPPTTWLAEFHRGFGGGPHRVQALDEAGMSCACDADNVTPAATPSALSCSLAAITNRQGREQLGDIRFAPAQQESAPARTGARST